MTKKKTLQNMIIIVIAIVAIALSVNYLLSLKKADSEPQNEALEIQFNKQGALAFVSNESNDTISVIDIEVADTNELRARGLMYRKSIPVDAGMLFIFDREEVQGFWMKNTYIALDMIFVNADKEIVTIHMNTSPMKEWNYASTKPALYVVEVNAGYCIQNNIKTGDKIAIL